MKTIRSQKVHFLQFLTFLCLSHTLFRLKVLRQRDTETHAKKIQHSYLFAVV